MALSAPFRVAQIPWSRSGNENPASLICKPLLLARSVFPWKCQWTARTWSISSQKHLLTLTPGGLGGGHPRSSGGPGAEWPSEQEMIKPLTGADQPAEGHWSCGGVGSDYAAKRALIKLLRVADILADRCWSSGWQVLIKLLTRVYQAADRCWSSRWFSLHFTAGITGPRSEVYAGAYSVLFCLHLWFVAILVFPLCPPEYSQSLSFWIYT